MNYSKYNEKNITLSTSKNEKCHRSPHPHFLLLPLNPFPSPISSVCIFPLFPILVLFFACLLFYSLLPRPICHSISSSNSLISQPLTEFLSLNYKPHFRLRASCALPECMFRLTNTKNTWWALLLEMRGLVS